MDNNIKDYVLSIKKLTYIIAVTQRQTIDGKSKQVVKEQRKEKLLKYAINVMQYLAITPNTSVSIAYDKNGEWDSKNVICYIDLNKSGNFTYRLYSVDGKDLNTVSSNVFYHNLRSASNREIEQANRIYNDVASHPDKYSPNILVKTKYHAVNVAKAIYDENHAIWATNKSVLAEIKRNLPGIDQSVWDNLVGLDF